MQSPLAWPKAFFLLSILLLLPNCGGGGGDGEPNFVPADFGLDARPANTSCVAPERPATTTEIAIEDAFPNLEFRQPLGLVQVPGDNSRWYVLEKGGRIWIIDNDPATADRSLFIDISDRVDASHTESGLLGMAFHPDFATNGQVFLSYTAPGSPLVSRVSRFSADAGGIGADPGSEQVILELAQTHSNHNGGHILFGPDGYLYIGLGDSGSGGDPDGNGQNLATLFGAVLRIDVNGGAPYAVPPDNPFANGAGGARPEIWAYGFRNPWRFSFDRLTGEMWLGDVGQDAYEEVNRVEPGGNYGWNIREGMHCYAAATCDIAGLIDPVAEYSHAEGASITGGFVYRGSTIPVLQGIYLYGDFSSGRIWGLFPEAGGFAPRPLLDAVINIATFAEDMNGEIFMTGLSDGKIHRLVPAGAGAGGGAPFPQRLSETGCMLPEQPAQPGPGLIPYDINVPFWSDGAAKQRWMALPDGGTIDVDADGDWRFPIGTVFVKHFFLGERLIETRLFMRHPDGEWGGYSYEWDDAQSDAVLVLSGRTKAIDGQTWTFPSSAQCLECHTEAAGRALGPETAQMNRQFDYHSTFRRANQIDTLVHIGLLASPPAPAADLPSLPSTGDTARPLDDRARAYLHSNCSHCHRPSGAAGAGDFRFHVPEPEMRVCEATPQHGDLGLPGARLLAPGDPARSILSLRMRALDAARMPPLASHRVDVEGADLIDAWIAAKTACP